LPQILLGTKDVLKLVPTLTPRQIQNYDELKIIPAYRKIGHRRHYTERELFALMLHVECTAVGIGVIGLHKYFKAMLKKVHRDYDLVLLSDDMFVPVPNAQVAIHTFEQFCKRRQRPCSIVNLKSIRNRVDHIVSELCKLHGFDRAA
jgi:DNA-binding transcriptional MerR regulator